MGIARKMRRAAAARGRREDRPLVEPFPGALVVLESLVEDFRTQVGLALLQASDETTQIERTDNGWLLSGKEGTIALSVSNVRDEPESGDFVELTCRVLFELPPEIDDGWPTAKEVPF